MSESEKIAIVSIFSSLTKIGSSAGSDFSNLSGIGPLESASDGADPIVDSVGTDMHRSRRMRGVDVTRSVGVEVLALYFVLRFEDDAAEPACLADTRDAASIANGDEAGSVGDVSTKLPLAVSPRHSVESDV